MKMGFQNGASWLVVRRPEVGIYVTTVAIISVLTLIGSISFLTSDKSVAASSVQTSASTQVEIAINSVISLAIESCDTGQPDYQTTTKISVNPGKQSNQCQNITVDTNASGGYSLTVLTNSSNLTHATITPSPPVIPSTPATIASPVALADTSTGTWGFAVGKGQTKAANLFGCFNPTITTQCPGGSTFDAVYAPENNVNSSTAKYAAFPTTTTTLAQTDQFNVGADTYQLWFATRIPTNKPGGVYQTTVTYTVTGENLPEPPPILSTPPPEFITKSSNIVPNFASTITPSGNGSGTNGPQFSIYGSGFGSSPTITIGGQSCTDVIVNSGGTAITCTGPVSGLSDGEQEVKINGVDAGPDYTVWYSSYTFPTLQSLTTSGSCLGTAANPVIYRDSRDSQLYYVARLADNKCWMLDSLKYKPNGDTSGTNQAGFVATQIVSAGAYLTVDGTDTNTSAGGPNLDAAKYVDPIGAATSYCRSNANISSENITKCGFLYNFYTVNAGTLTYSDVTNGMQSSGSICPANWRLPTGRNASGDFGVLDIAYGGTGATQSGTPAQLATLWFPVGAWRGVFGGYYNTGFVNQGGNFYYWSSSVSSAAISYRLYFDSSSVSPGTNSSYRYNGFAVRCVL